MNIHLVLIAQIKILILVFIRMLIFESFRQTCNYMYLIDLIYSSVVLQSVFLIFTFICFEHLSERSYTFFIIKSLLTSLHEVLLFSVLNKDLTVCDKIANQIYSFSIFIFVIYTSIYIISILIWCFDRNKEKENTLYIHQTVVTITPEELGEDCSICIEKRDMSVYTLPCGHHFHLECIEQWLVANETCPNCRESVLI